MAKKDAHSFWESKRHARRGKESLSQARITLEEVKMVWLTYQKTNIFTFCLSAGFDLVLPDKKVTAAPF